MKRNHLWLAVLLVLALALVPALIGCGDDDTEDTATEDSMTEDTATEDSMTEDTATEDSMTEDTATEDTAAGEATVVPVDEELSADIEAVQKSENIETPPTIDDGMLQGGSDTAFPPFEFADDQGDYVGFDVDLMTAIAKKMGLEFEIVPTAWDGIIPALVSDRYDIIASAMTITEEREEQISFSDPYISADIAISAPVDSPIETAEDLADKTVGVQIDTTGQFAVEEIEDVGEIRKYETILNAFQDLETGRLDAVVNDAPVNAYIIRDNPNVENTGTIETGDVYGYGLKQENEQLRDAINQALQELKDEGLYDRIFQKWFGELPAEQQ